MSIVRSSSSVSNLRAVFENRERSQSRGRSPTNSQSGSNSGHSPVPTRKIRSSFVAVEPSGRKIPATMSNSESIGQGEPTQARRDSFSLSEKKDQDAIENMKKTVGGELAKRKSQQGLKAGETVPEAAATSAAATPSVDEVSNPIASAGGDAVSGTKGQSENPDKSISSVEDASASLLPAGIKDEATVSGGIETENNKTNGDTSKRSTATSAKGRATGAGSKRLSTSTNSSVNRRTSSIGGTSAPPARSKPRSPTRPVQLPSHLTAQTASSRAKHQQDEQTLSKSSASSSRVSREIPAHLLAPTASSKAKHEEEPKKQTTPTKAREVPSHLLAPTAASRAKHEEVPKADSTATSAAAGASKVRGARTSLAPRQSLGPAATRTTRPAASRQSLAGQAGAPAIPVSKKTTAPSSDFLARMTRPTESSSSHKTGEPKSEVAGAKHETKPVKAPVRSKPAGGSTPVKPHTPAKLKKEAESLAVASDPAPGTAAAAQPDPAISSEAVAEPTQKPELETAASSAAPALTVEDQARVEAISQAVESATKTEAAQALKEVQSVEQPTDAQAINTPKVSSSLDQSSTLASTIPSAPAPDHASGTKSAADVATAVEPVIPDIPVRTSEKLDPEPTKPEAIEPEAEKTEVPKSESELPEVPEQEAKTSTGKKSKSKKNKKAKAAAAAAAAAAETSEDKKSEVSEVPVEAVTPTAEAETVNKTESKIEPEEIIPEEFIPKDVTPAKPLSPIKAKPSEGGLMAASKYADKPDEPATKESAPLKRAEEETAAAASTTGSNSTSTPTKQGANEDDVAALQTPAFNDEVIH